ncbi:slipin family protein [Winogradskyella sp.]|jgi:regulator of protease activity HflC (stomatin/prohibitin superfamily)|uniref:slipin family protein n=1 Tax=Winogradskyella sp. TaxID=1883156 RepID=UPI0025F5801D|nr:slipin family protein [Winogradskyella sp.]MCT4630187.1 slipin family protein [Winogradskyella sp.]
MKRVRIHAGMVGLVFKNGNYTRVITEGKHWISFREHVAKYSLSQPFNAPRTLEILLKDQALAELLNVIEVKDNEIVLVYENGNFKQVLSAGRHTYWNDLIDYKFVTADLSKIEITEAIEKAIYSKPELSKYIRTFEIAAFEKAIMIVNDMFVKTLEHGTYHFWRNDQTIKIAKADMRQLQLEIAGQELLTKDKATVRINFYAQYKVTNIETALMHNKDYEKQLYIILQLALRAFVGAYTLDELLEQKETIAKAVLSDVKVQASKLGVNVLHTGIRDVILPGDMKDIMNQVLIAHKKAQANVVTRREETASTRSLLNTAKLMEDNSMLFKLKEMEYVEKIADKIGEITVAGNGNVIEQLKDIFSVNK